MANFFKNRFKINEKFFVAAVDEYLTENSSQLIGPIVSDFAETSSKGESLVCFCKLVKNSDGSENGGSG